MSEDEATEWRHGMATEEPPAVAALSYETELRDLLAVVHRDGGHYTSKAGIVLATAEAMHVVSQLYSQISERRCGPKDRRYNEKVSSRFINGTRVGEMDRRKTKRAQDWAHGKAYAAPQEAVKTVQAPNVGQPQEPPAVAAPLSEEQVWLAAYLQALHVTNRSDSKEFAETTLCEFKERFRK